MTAIFKSIYQEVFFEQGALPIKILKEACGRIHMLVNLLVKSL